MDVQLGSPKSRCVHNWAKALSELNGTDFSTSWLRTAAHESLSQGTNSPKLTPLTHNWQKSPIWWHKLLQKNLEIQLVWSCRIIISKQIKKFQHFLSLKNSSQTLANTLKLLITVANESQKYLQVGMKRDEFAWNHIQKNGNPEIFTILSLSPSWLRCLQKVLDWQLKKIQFWFTMDKINQKQ